MASRKDRRQRLRLRGRATGYLPTGTVSELAVAIDLLEKGFGVFRALANNAACDLIILDKSNALHRVEVKTGKKQGNRIVCRQKADPAKYDILAITCGAEILYIPGLPTSSPYCQDAA